MEIIIVSGKRKKTESTYVYHAKQKRVGVGYCSTGINCPQKVITVPLTQEIHPCYKDIVDNCYTGGFYELDEKRVDMSGCSNCS